MQTGVPIHEKDARTQVYLSGDTTILKGKQVSRHWCTVDDSRLRITKAEKFCGLFREIWETCN